MLYLGFYAIDKIKGAESDINPKLKEQVVEETVENPGNCFYYHAPSQEKHQASIPLYKSISHDDHFVFPRIKIPDDKLGSSIFQICFFSRPPPFNT